ncbi:hypothetical protein [Mesorhizobium sp. dw_380]|uniref:hypothetical protein n=1 Tax=Mesorhizobium sp. dw_380 TaxID=2812001 RepID=UPI002032DE0E|nr:hypothetical protein [Mesorhizobium sp. dw_380]
MTAPKASPALIADTTTHDLVSKGGGDPWRVFIHAGENHMSILLVTVNRAVQAAFAVRGRETALC